jgi:hypothetical protein
LGPPSFSISASLTIDKIAVDDERKFASAMRHYQGTAAASMFDNLGVLSPDLMVKLETAQ